MRKLIAGACAIALAATASPALAGGGNGNGGRSSQWQGSQFNGNFDRLARAFWAGHWGQGFGSHGKHFGWFRGKHWGWFKPHNPHWPHHPTSP